MYFGVINITIISLGVDNSLSLVWFEKENEKREGRQKVMRKKNRF